MRSFGRDSRFGFRSQILERGQDSVGAGIDADWRDIAPVNDPVGIDNEEGAFADAFFFVVNAIGVRDRSFRFEIGQKRKVQLVVLGERGVTPRAVHRYAEEFSLKLLKFVQHFVVERHLIAAHRTPVGGVNREHHWSSTQLAQRYGLVWCASQGEVGSPRAGKKDRTVTVCLSLGIRSGCTHYIYVRLIRWAWLKAARLVMRPTYVRSTEKC